MISFVSQTNIFTLIKDCYKHREISFCYQYAYLSHIYLHSKYIFYSYNAFYFLFVVANINKIILICIATAHKDKGILKYKTQDLTTSFQNNKTSI